jgi:uncharacterized repeat protein (TIGR04076 family)
MEVVKITVKKRTVNNDLAKEITGKEVSPCEIFTDGQVFITGFTKPDGFCEWAWTDISRMFLAINTGGNFKDWLKRDGLGISCCSDGLRPVVFTLERVDSKSLIDISKAENPAPLDIYGSERWGEFSYAFPRLDPDAPYLVRLHFCEIFFQSAGKRRFSVEAGGKAALEDFDIVAQAGGQFKAIVKEFTASADSNGSLVLQFKKGLADQPKVSAIEILKPGAAKPVYAINAGGGPSGAFAADGFFQGGTAYGA